MGFSDEEFREIARWEYAEEKRLGLLFPNWGACKYRDGVSPSDDGVCPSEVRERREAGLLMGYCSNNDSILGCEMYRKLECCSEGGCDSLVKVCSDDLAISKKKVS